MVKAIEMFFEKRKKWTTKATNVTKIHKTHDDGALNGGCAFVNGWNCNQLTAVCWKNKSKME